MAIDDTTNTVLNYTGCVWVV